MILRKLKMTLQQPGVVESWKIVMCLKQICDFCYSQL
jgi:hypothetical protein